MHNSRVAVALMDSAMIFGAGARPHFAVVRYVSLCLALLLFIIVSREKGRPHYGATL